MVFECLVWLIFFSKHVLIVLLLAYFRVIHLILDLLNEFIYLVQLGLAGSFGSVLFDQAVEPVFHLNLRSALDLKTNFVPLVSHHDPQLENLRVFLNGPFSAFHARVNNVDPAFATLPWLTPRFWSHQLVEFFSNASPFFWLNIVHSSLFCLFLSDFCRYSF